jgi:hypothetical protein
VRHHRPSATRARAACTSVAILALAADASADPDLTLHHAPVRHLRMRRPSVAATPVAATPVTATPPSPTPHPATHPKPAVQPEPLLGVREPDQKVNFQLDLGYAIDGTQLADQPQSLGGHTERLGVDVQQIRSYEFADAYLSTHGVGITPLTTYFAARLELTDPLTGPDPRSGGATTAPLAPPIASWFDHDNLMLRSGWAQLTDFLPTGWAQPISMRIGQQYVYGPWVMHLQGAVASWKDKVIDATAYAGRRAPDYTYALLDSEQPTILGAQLKVDLRDTAVHVPFVLAGDAMQLQFADGTHSTSYQGELDWRPDRDIVVVGSARMLDGSLAHERLQLRGRYGQVTNFVVDVQGRQSADWQWDPTLVGQPTDASEARRYLDLGPVQPQLLASLRVGTVLFDNVDLLARGALANDMVSDPSQQTSQNASYREIAGAAEVRLRRTVALGASVLRRTISHPQQDAPIPDTLGPLPLPTEVVQGEDGFVEIGTNARLSLGARKLSATIEVYGRKTDYAPLYCAPMMVGTNCTRDGSGVPYSDIHGGGRVTVDAYVGSRLRLYAAYDLSSGFAFAPEITGYKSLRLVMEGVY